MNHRDARSRATAGAAVLSGAAAVALILLMSLLSAARAAERAVVSVIFSSDIRPYVESWKGFKSSLSRNNVSLWSAEYNLKENDADSVASRIRRAKPDIVLALGSQALKLAAERLNDIPVVYCMVIYPESIGRINGSGVSMDIPPDIRLREIKRLLPHVDSIGVVYSSDLEDRFDGLERAAGRIPLRMVGRRIESEKQLPDALKDVASRTDCLLMLPDTRIYFPASVEYLLLESLRMKYPVIGLSSYYTKAGALLSFDCDYEDLGSQAGDVALRILDGEAPAGIRPLRPRRVRYSVNLLAAERLKVRFSHQAIRGASEVIRK